jgi:glycerol-3-phosphate acyltransferase PlsY
MFIVILVMLCAYLIGSIPVGYLMVKTFTGQDIREVGSGRTGSTNVMRVGGTKIAMLTGVFDALKGTAAVELARWLTPNNPWMLVLAGVAAILGHNYSVFIGFKGGAGGAPTVGVAGGLWPGSVLWIIPIGAAVWYFIGYASLTTISFTLAIIVIMFIRWYLGLAPVEYIYFGGLALIICLWSLRPNLKRLAAGTERVVGWRARQTKQSNKE